MEALDRVFAEIADYTKTMGGLHGDFLQVVRRDIDRFKEMTDKQCEQMQWQGWLVLSLTTFSASLAIAGACIPKGSSPAVTDSQLGSRNFVSKMLKTIGDKLKDNDFLREACKTASTSFDRMTSPIHSWQQSKITQFQSKCELHRLGFQEGQQEKGSCAQEAKRSQETALSILQAKAKGN